MPAFFVREGEEFHPTLHTRGPWSLEHQHGGPPSALLGRALWERARQDFDAMPARVTAEFFRPIPILPLRIEVSVLRPGKQAITVCASLFHEDRELMRAFGLFLRRRDPSGLPRFENVALNHPAPESVASFEFPFFLSDIGYDHAVDLRIVRGEWGKGETVSWMRMRYPLVLNEAPSGFERVLLVADSGNGLSPLVDPQEITFVNPDLGVYLHRVPAGEWVGLAAKTSAQSWGQGLARTELFDGVGELGIGLQSLILTPRSS